MPISGTKYIRSKNVFSVISIALSCGRVWARLSQPLAQSLIGSPGTLITTGILLTNFKGAEIKKSVSGGLMGT